MISLCSCNFWIPQGHVGLTQDTFLSLPCVLGLNGVNQVVKIALEPDEFNALKISADAMEKLQKDIKY